MKLLEPMSPSSFPIVHSKHDSPVCPHQVTPETPLDGIDLNWQEHNLPEREKIRHVHGLPPFLGKFISQLAEVFLRKFFTPGPTVPDPFVGSGTTLIQANELGVNSIGYDISAFNVLLMQVRTGNYNLPRVRAEIPDIPARTRMQTRLTSHPSAVQPVLWPLSELSGGRKKPEWNVNYPWLKFLRMSSGPCLRGDDVL